MNEEEKTDQNSVDMARVAQASSQAVALSLRDMSLDLAMTQEQLRLALLQANTTKEQFQLLQEERKAEKAKYEQQIRDLNNELEAVRPALDEANENLRQLLHEHSNNGSVSEG